GLATHILPFAVAVLINWTLRDIWGDSAIGAFLSGAIGMALLVPFLLGGHGLAVATLHQLHPGAEPSE
ncbi:MAG TPA: hypothetical protein DCX29_04280, partial [Hyphomonas sp.]|nr:hypothetical protein [Hyphomonas sp.]